MTTNIECATEVIGVWIDNNLPHSEQNFGADEGIAQALADAGLLMPDLQGPSTTPETDPEWANQYREEWDSEPPIAVWNHKDTDWWLSVYASSETAGGWSEYAEEEFDHLNAKKLRAIASMMIAAADKIDQIKKATPAL